MKRLIIAAVLLATQAAATECGEPLTMRLSRVELEYLQDSVQASITAWEDYMATLTPHDVKRPNAVREFNRFAQLRNHLRYVARGEP